MTKTTDLELMPSDAYLESVIRKSKNNKILAKRRLITELSDKLEENGVDMLVDEEVVTDDEIEFCYFEIENCEYSVRVKDNTFKAKRLGRVGNSSE